MAEVLAEPRIGSQRDRALTLIAIFKLSKAALLIVAGLGALKLVQPGAAQRAQAWVAWLAANTGSRMIHDALARLIGLEPRHLEELGLVAFAYAALFLVEGVGLWMGRRWAEYLTVIATSSLLPFEIYELTRKLSVPRVTALFLNVAVVVYLVLQLKRRRA
jgi:uncharacterized membrane protein (DUF2068 family)